VLDLGCVLGGQHDGVDARWPAIRIVLDRDLALGVRTQPRQHALLAQLRLTLHEPMREHDRHRHELAGFVDGEAEHQPLIAGALVLVQALPLRHALRDVG
jgi:hypothetical protein